MTPYISIVIPVYNSENGLDELFAGIDAAMGSSPYEVIFIDDGSKDNSWKKLVELKNKHPQKIVSIKFARNFGQHNAILCGFGFCKGELIVTMDDDLQHPPEEIAKLVAKYEETRADVVYGVYNNKQHGIVQNAGSYFVKKTSKYFENKMGEGSSFRLIKKEIAQKIKENHQHNFLFIDEVIQWYTGNITFANVNHNARKYGKSSYSFFKLTNLYFNILVNYSALPLKLMTYSGLLFSIITFFMGMRFIYKKLVHNVPLGYTSTIVSILFTASIILLCLGIIGQYIYKLYQFQHHKPPYSIQTVI